MIRKVFFRLVLFILSVKYKELQPGSIRPFAFVHNFIQYPGFAEAA